MRTDSIAAEQMLKALAGEDSMGRKRGTYVTHTVRAGYDSYEESRWKADPAGDLIRSCVGRLHAPIFDVDQAVSRVSTEGGLTTLRVAHGDRKAALRSVRRLARLGMLPTSLKQAHLDALHSSIVTTGRYGSYDLTLAAPIRVHESRTPGHVHLYVDQLMRMRTSRRFAKALGFVDHDYIKASANYWCARVPTK